MSAPPNVVPTDEVPRSSQKAAYALSLQKACKTALERVKSNNVIANSSWASPLAAAPSAISTMAILFKVADAKCAAGLKVESQDVMEGTVVKGRLPDVGRLAFMDAQHGMSEIRATARSLISQHGSIGTIIDMLEDPEDARTNLKPEIEAIKKSAKKCLDGAQAITSKFAYWHLVIIHLQQNSVTSKEEVIEQRKATAVLTENAQLDQSDAQKREAATREELKNLQKNLALAEAEVDRAQKHVDYLRYQPVVIEPSAFEEIERVKRLIPQTSLPAKDRGRLVGFRDWAWGQSDEHAQEDAVAQKAHQQRIQQLQNQALTQAREQRHRQQQLAARLLAEAHQFEQSTKEQLTEMYGKLAENNDRLVQAQADLARTRRDLSLLGDRELELVDLMEILDNSKKQLATLKDQIEPLVDFFTDILKGIKHTVDEDLEAFLRPINSGIVGGNTPDEVAALALSQKSKVRIMTNALQMQGNFSAIADISGAYITVSTDYIRPAIRDMENLSALSGSEWNIRSQEFSGKCTRYIEEINDLAQKTTADAETNIRYHVGLLEKRAITAAEDNE